MQGKTDVKEQVTKSLNSYFVLSMTGTFHELLDSDNLSIGCDSINLEYSLTGKHWKGKTAGLRK